MRRGALALVVLVLAAPLAGAATYYVDCNANGDAGAGTGTGAAVAWKTVAKVNSSSFSAGDFILFRKGCIWREQLTIPSSGSAGSPVTFGSYDGASSANLSVATISSTDYSADANLQGYWQLEEDGTASRVDSSGKGNDLTHNGSPDRSATHQQGAYSNSLVRASSQYLTRANADLSAAFPGKAGSAAMSVVAWVNPTSVTNENWIASHGDNIWGIGGNSGGAPFNNRIRCFVGTDSIYSVQGVHPTGQWTHVAMTYDGANIRLYINGIEDANSPVARVGTVPANTGWFAIGSRESGNTQFYDGLIDEVAVFDRLLSSSEIGEIINSRLDGSGGSPNIYTATTSLNIASLTIDGSPGTRARGTANLASNGQWTLVGSTLALYRDSAPSTVSAGINSTDATISGANGSTAAWTAEGSLWYTSAASAEVVVVNGTKCAPSANKVDLSAGTYEYWFDSGNGRHYIVTDGVVDPNSAEVQISARSYGVRLATKHDVTVSGLRVQHATIGNISGTGIGANIIVSGNTSAEAGAGGTGGFDGIDLFGSKVAPSTGARVANNVLTGNLNNGVEVWGLDAPEISGNTGSLNGGGIELWGYITNAVIERNLFADNSPSTGSPSSGRGFWATNTSAGTDTGNHSGNAIRYNIFTNSTQRGIQIDSGTDWSIYNNTVHNTTGADSAPLDINGSGTSVALSNNLFWMSQSDSRAFIIGQNAADVTLTGDNNLFYPSATGSPFLYNGTWSTLAAFKSASGQSHTIGLDPLFVGASDFRLQPNSPAINAGVDVGLTQDFVGRAIIGLPDIGAYEYAGCSVFSLGHLLEDIRYYLPGCGVYKIGGR